MRCNIEPTAMDGGERCTGCYRIMNWMPVWLRRLHAPGWGGVAVAVARGRSVEAAAAPGRERNASTAPDRNQDGRWIQLRLWKCRASMIKITEWDVLMETGR